MKKEDIFSIAKRQVGKMALPFEKSGVPAKMRQVKKSRRQKRS